MTANTGRCAHDTPYGGTRWCYVCGQPWDPPPAPSSRPDTPAQEHADKIREVVRRLSGTGDVPVIDFALDALLAEITRLTAEREEWKRGAISWTEIAGGHKAVADDERARAEAAERERDWLREQLDRQTENAAVFLRERDEARHIIECADTPLMRDVLAAKLAAEALAERRGDALRQIAEMLPVQYQAHEIARAALAEDASHQDAGEPGYGGDGDGAAA